MAMITLTTDFGNSDYYVAAMKGIICQIAPKATIVDITHGIAPGNVLSGALILREVWRTFPANTIHVAVIDPGVGTDRKILLAKYSQQLFLVPDNGLITLIHQVYPAEQINVVTNSQYFCQPVCPTFHGRDVFAPVAAHLSKGLTGDQLGPRTQTVNLLDLPITKPTGQGTLTGQVIHIDHFGNLITSIGDEALHQLARITARHLSVELDGKSIGPIRNTFADVPEGQALAYIGSAGMLEIGVNHGRADATLSARCGSTVQVK